MNTLGKRIRLLRQEKGWSQDEVSRRLDISIPAFSKIETGITDINLSRLEQIAALFKLSAVELLSFQDHDQAAFSDELTQIHQQLKIRESELIDLQKKVIGLFDELRQVPKK